MKLTRRSFFEKVTAFGAFLGINISATAASTNPVPRIDKYDPGTYTLEIDSPPNDNDRPLPVFDTFASAQNFAYSRASLLRSSSQYTPHSHEAGTIKIYNERGAVVQCTTWGETWETTIVDLHPKQWA
jgi:hypothetical protein